MITSIVLLTLALAYPALLTASAWRTGTGRPRKWGLGLRDRLDVLVRVVSCVTVLVAARALVAWDTVPVAVWGGGAALAVFGSILGVSAGRTLPGLAGDRPARRAAGAVLNLLICAGFVVAVS